MCYGEIVSERMLVARRANSCSHCDAKIAKGEEFYFSVARGFDDGKLGNMKLCMRCAAFYEDTGEGMACSSEIEDTPEETVVERVASGLKKLRERFAKKAERIAARQSRGEGAS